jgi:ribose 5-phosphate isomerase B
LDELDRSSKIRITRLYVANDHAGYDLKHDLLTRLKKTSANVEVMDFGSAANDRVDYPDFAKKVVMEILNSEPHIRKVGLLICGSGQGMAMSANRYKGIRAALAWNDESAKLSRAHNDANILCLGARLLTDDVAWSALQIFLKQEFEGGRHLARIEKF